MKLSIRLVTLLAGTATGSPFGADKQQTDPEAEQSHLKDYCAKSGLQAGIVKPIGEEVDRELMGTCLRNKDDFKIEDGPSLEDNLAFCKKLGRGFGGSAVPHNTADYTIWCKGEPVGTGAAAADEQTSMNLFNEIISKSNKDGKGQIDGAKLLEFLQALARDAPGTLTGMYNALKARPSSAKSLAGLGGAANTVAGTVTILYDFIMANVGTGGLIGPETAAGRWLRTNPFYGRAGTRPSPHGIDGAVSIDGDTDTHLCMPFKDESRWYWTTDVKRCKYWHDRQPCDTSYALDAASELGKEQKRICEEERRRNEMTQPEKEEQRKKEEASCVRPKWACLSLKDGERTFEYCMDESETSKTVCGLNKWAPELGREETQDEKKRKEEEKRKQEMASCHSPRLYCTNVCGKFLYCMDDDKGSQKYRECATQHWRPTYPEDYKDSCPKL